MFVVRSKYAHDYPLWQLTIYNLLYTASFATLFIHLWFPFDVFLINIFIIQLPVVIWKQTTLHGYLAGNILTIKK